MTETTAQVAVLSSTAGAVALIAAAALLTKKRGWSLPRFAVSTVLAGAFASGGASLVFLGSLVSAGPKSGPTSDSLIVALLLGALAVLAGAAAGVALGEIRTLDKRRLLGAMLGAFVTALLALAHLVLLLTGFNSAHFPEWFLASPVLIDPLLVGAGAAFGYAFFPPKSVLPGPA